MNIPVRIQRHILFLSLISAAMVLSVHASELDTPNSFTSGTPAVAAEVNENFTAAEEAINDNDSRLTTVETTLTDVLSRLETLESKSPALTVDTYFATDLVFLLANGSLTIPAGVDGNQSEPGSAGTGREWHALPGLTAVSFTVEDDGTLILLQAEGEAYYPYWSSFAGMEAGILVNGEGPAPGAQEGLTIVTDDTTSAGRDKWHILHPVELDAGEHTFSVVVRVPYSGNEGDGSIGLDGRSTGDHPGKIKATVFTIH
ncbi:hypothetical protein [Saccharospirillum salsuginis]|uniref:Uncharacterized protein n=1 Tax=Saccharospirillum salsuginis TaxID=418750 RepID=A0A918KTP9_9GAMM|nr:hypothetical protein [Saccharospirillum salsuginis]GGX73473.1 hypothetical protein GCM10007392_46140 [Saccharospirillum salsuginis]